MPGAAHSQNGGEFAGFEFAGFGESSTDAPAVPIDAPAVSIDVVPPVGASEAEALAKLKWQQKKGLLCLGVVLFAATAAVFIEAATNKGLQGQSMLDNDEHDDDDRSWTRTIMDYSHDKRTCTYPGTSLARWGGDGSTAHFGDCCGEYGITPKPLWVLLLQSLLAAFIFDSGGHMWTGKADFFSFGNLNNFSKAYLILQGILSMTTTYSILAKYNYAEFHGWENYNGLIFVWLNSSAGPAVATVLNLWLRAIGATGMEAETVLIQEIGAVKYAALSTEIGPDDQNPDVEWSEQLSERRERLKEVEERLAAVRTEAGKDSLVGGYIVIMNWILTLLAIPALVTHMVAAFLIYIPLAVVLQMGFVYLPRYLYTEPIFPADPEKPHTVMERLVYVPARALISSWGFCCVMIHVVLFPTWVIIFYVNTSWHGALVQDWESRDTGRFFACLNTQFQSVIGGADAVGLIF